MHAQSSVPQRWLGVAFLLAGIVAVGCSGIGPKTIPRDRFDYTETLSTSWKQQMLANMVKLRYGDAPVFLDVASVINQYSVETQVDLRLSWVDPAGDSQSAGGSARYTDKPTITYTPLSGERFARSLMKPLPPPALLSLVQAGYPIDLILRTCTHSVNGVRNRYGGSARTRPADPDFYPLLQRLRRMQDSGALSLRVQQTAEMEGILLTLRGKVDPELEQDVLAVREILGLDPTAQEFRVVYGSIAADDREIAILSRSMLEVLVDLGADIDVPAEHVREKRVNPRFPTEMLGQDPIPPLIQIHSSSGRPSDYLAAIPYRGHWYWIDDRDLRSKAVFTFLMFVFSLTETEGRDDAPIVTIPAG